MEETKKRLGAIVKLESYFLRNGKPIYHNKLRKVIITLKMSVKCLKKINFEKDYDQKEVNTRSDRTEQTLFSSINRSIFSTTLMPLINDLGVTKYSELISERSNLNKNEIKISKALKIKDTYLESRQFCFDTSIDAQYTSIISDSLKIKKINNEYFASKIKLYNYKKHVANIKFRNYDYINKILEMPESRKINGFSLNFIPRKFYSNHGENKFFVFKRWLKTMIVICLIFLMWIYDLVFIQSLVKNFGMRYFIISTIQMSVLFLVNFLGISSIIILFATILHLKWGVFVNFKNRSCKAFLYKILVSVSIRNHLDAIIIFRRIVKMKKLKKRKNN